MGLTLSQVRLTLVMQGVFFCGPRSQKLDREKSCQELSDDKGACISAWQNYGRHQTSAWLLNVLWTWLMTGEIPPVQGNESVTDKVSLGKHALNLRPW